MTRQQGTRNGRWTAALFGIALVASAVAVARGDDGAPQSGTVGAQELRHAVEQSMRGDAALADVWFVDRRAGWAVGDRGVIWHTADGGRSWHEQASRVSCRLDSVFFFDRRRGWAVGGAIRPATHASRGVVLRTRDGGATWSQAPGLLVPKLTHVEFFDDHDGVAVGAGSSVFPGGVFLTSDGGQSWRPFSADGQGDWLTGDFIDREVGAVAGSAGRTATVFEGRVALSPRDNASARSLRALRLAGPLGGWLVGDGGLVMTTHNSGRTWQTPPAELPQFVADDFDFHALAVLGSHVWIAGAPGSRIFHSPDGGQTWQAASTGQTVPLRALSFVDAQTGWAVGDLGTILTTSDGGRSWRPQRAGGRRAALWAVFGRATDVPLELVAQYGAAEGYLTSVDVLLPPAVGDLPTAADSSATERGRAAMIAAGATTADAAWQFPRPPADLALSADDLIATLNRHTDGQAVERLKLHLVRELRTWKPEIVVTYHPDAAQTDSIAGLMQQLILDCVEAAADPTQYVDLATDAGLGAWQVKRVYGLLPAHHVESPAAIGVGGSQRVDPNRFSRRLGRTLADWTAPARHLLYTTDEPPAGMYELQPLVGDTDNITGRDLFAGIALTPGSDARRPAVALPEGDLEALERMAQKRRNMRKLLARTEGNAAWAGQVAHLVDGLDATSGGELLFQLAEGYREAGQLDLAADTYYLLARRWPDHPLTDRALVWLVQFYASSETARSCQPSAVSRQPDEQQPLLPDSPQPPADGSIQQTSASAPIGAVASPAVGLSRDGRLRRAVQLGEYLEASRPAVFAEPAVRFPLVAAQRQLGYTNPAQRYFLTLRGLPEDNPWRRCGETELWFAQPGDQPPPKTLGACRRANGRPHLDGQLDESLWESADALRLTGEKIPAVRLVYDAEFLYVGIRCPKAAGVDYTPDDRPRSRDADLSERDRVALRIDVDRDFTTYLELIVDSRGWPRDACWGDLHWNPTWFIAAADDGACWTVEAAVPLSELTSEPPAPRHVWAVAVRRTIPRTGHQSWAGEEEASPSDSPDGTPGGTPDQFGLVIFQ